MKNKPSLLLALVIILFGGLAYGQSITINNPQSGITWYKGKSYNITWTRSGSMDSMVKIRLYNTTGTTKILNIVNSTLNDDHFSWVVPATVADGDYIIRVKTLDNKVSDNGGIFSIKKPKYIISKVKKLIPSIDTRPDLKVSIKVPNIILTWLTKLTFTVHNDGILNSSKCYLKILIYSLVGGKPPKLIGQTSYTVYAVKNGFPSTFILKSAHFNKKGTYSIHANIDYTGKVDEKNENNNLSICVFKAPK